MQRIPFLRSRPRLLIFGLAVLAVAITFFVWFEVTRSREELLRFVEAEAGVLIQTINRSTETTLAANAELERALVQRLQLAARLVDLRSETSPSIPSSTFAREMDLDRVMLIDAEGRVSAADAADVAGQSLRDTSTGLFDELLRPVLEHRFSWLAQGGVQLPGSRQDMFVLVQEREHRPGVVLVGVSSANLLEMRLRLGVGKLLRDIGSGATMVYVVLQDEGGILTASEGVEEMSRIADDAFLRRALDSDSTRSRLIEAADPPVFEVVRRLQMEGRETSLMRIGLSLALVRDIQQRSMHRVVFIAFGFFITAAILLILLSTRQRYGALRQEHRRIRGYTDLVLDNIADAVVATNATGTVTVFNQAAAKLLGLGAGSALGKSCSDLCNGDAFLLHRTRDEARPVAYEETALRQGNGEIRMLAVSTSVISDEGGAVETIVAIARDVTEQRRIRDQLQRRDRVAAMGELAGGIAHEIRNPLNAINIIAQRFQHEFTPAEGADEYTQLVRTIRSEVQRVNGIVTQFLEFARPPRLSLLPCDLNELLRECLDIVRSQAVLKHADMPVIADDDLHLMADREKILQALLNIYQNALDVLPENGRIKTITCRRGERIMLSIADNGPGMSDEVRQKIFNLYFTTKSTGTGLGLSIVHQIVSEHGGEIRVASNEDGGSTFQILLPATGSGDASASV